MSNCLGVNDTVGVATQNHLHSYVDGSQEFHLNANLRVNFESNAATRVCVDPDDNFTAINASTIYINSDVRDLPVAFDQSQLATNNLWNNTIQKLHVAMLPETLDSVYKMVPFVGFKYLVGNLDSEPKRIRRNETFYLLLMQKECASV